MKKITLRSLRSLRNRVCAASLLGFFTLLPAVGQAGPLQYSNGHIELSDTLIRADGTRSTLSAALPGSPDGRHVDLQLIHGGLAAGASSFNQRFFGSLVTQIDGFDPGKGETDIRAGTVGGDFSASGAVTLAVNFNIVSYDNFNLSIVTAEDIILVQLVVNGMTLLNREFNFMFVSPGTGNQGQLFPPLVNQTFQLAPGSIGSLLIGLTSIRKTLEGKDTQAFDIYNNLSFNLQQVPEVSTLATFLPGLLLLMFFRRRHIKDAIAPLVL